MNHSSLLRSRFSSLPLTTAHSIRFIHQSSIRLNNEDQQTLGRKLRGYSERGLLEFGQRRGQMVDSTKTTFSNLGAYLNNVTGYNEVERLKRRVVEQEEKIRTARQLSRTAKVSYSTAVTERGNLQKQLNDLLQRKHLWTDLDVATFTSLVRDDHSSSMAETSAKSILDKADETVEKEFTELMNVILARYHEEQVWSDKIRSASTFGSLGVMGLNLFVFVMAILVVEPWKRKRLAETFERKVDEMERVVRGDMEKVVDGLGDQKEVLDKVLVLLAANEASKPEPEEATWTTIWDWKWTAQIRHIYESLTLSTINVFRLLWRYIGPIQ